MKHTEQKFNDSPENERKRMRMSQRLTTFSVTGIVIGGTIANVVGGGIGAIIGAIMGLVFWELENQKAKPQNWLSRHNNSKD